MSIFVVFYRSDRKTMETELERMLLETELINTEHHM